MIAPRGSAAPPSGIRAKATAGSVLVVVGLALGGLGWSNARLGVVVVGAFLSAGVLVASRPRPLFRYGGPALAVAGLIAGSVGATLTPVSGALAGGTALALLYWAATMGDGGPPARDLADGLLLPGLATGVAIATALLLPATPDEVGVAAALAVGTFAYLAFVLTRVDETLDTEASSI
jgi:hypothetical protein